MISPQEPGNTSRPPLNDANGTYYYPTRGTTRVSVTHPASAYAYWRRRIGQDIALEIERQCDHETPRPCPYCINAAIIASFGNDK